MHQHLATSWACQNDTSARTNCHAPTRGYMSRGNRPSGKLWCARRVHGHGNKAWPVLTCRSHCNMLSGLARGCKACTFKVQAHQAVKRLQSACRLALDRVFPARPGVKHGGPAVRTHEVHVTQRLVRAPWSQQPVQGSRLMVRKRLRNALRQCCCNRRCGECKNRSILRIAPVHMHGEFPGGSGRISSSLSRRASICKQKRTDSALSTSCQVS